MDAPDLITHAIRLPDRDGRERVEILSHLFVLLCETTRKTVKG